MKNMDDADCGNITALLQQLGGYLDEYQQFKHGDAVQNISQWKPQLNQALPGEGVGIQKVMEEFGQILIPNASQIPNPGCTAFITTGATNIGAISALAGAVVAPQRNDITSFNFLEELSLDWLAQMFELPETMKGVYSSGGSVANLVALGAARQYAFEKLGIDPALDGVSGSCKIYTTDATHHTINRAAAVLGLGRNAVSTIATDSMGRMLPEALQQQITDDAKQNMTAIAIVANAGATSTGVIDPLQAIGEISRQHEIWFHVDGAYGLPGILDPQKRSLYTGLEMADSVIVDPHKWLGAPVGIGATFVRDRSLLHRAFTQGASDYLEGSLSDEEAQHSLDSLGIPYYDFGVELSSPSRGAVVWALIREIGKQGLQNRICRHNAMAQKLANIAKDHPNLELLQEPTLSICCFRYVTDDHADLNDLNKRIHRRMVHKGRSIPSTALINNQLAIRPCFVGARTTWQHVDELVEEVLQAASEILNEE
ncbi:MAG: aminotransferase class V-fold PLP-dependent enzyme [Gammaproteobacteria bacterium]|nr:aminotransferase class V-fold PLP-dependent enzyme [Gammaproteobacteria bacterium]